MQKQLLLLLATFGLLISAQSVRAQGPSADVCCYGYDESGEDLNTFTAPMKASDCTSGSKDRTGRHICGSSKNLDDCAYMSIETICTKCGLHWLKELSKCSKKSLEELVPKKEDAKTEEKK